jgi:hypothetical protein
MFNMKPASPVASLKAANKFLHDNGMPELVNLARGNGYYYFTPVGSEELKLGVEGIYVFNIRDLTYADVLTEWETRRKVSK